MGSYVVTLEKTGAAASKKAETRLTAVFNKYGQGVVAKAFPRLGVIVVDGIDEKIAEEIRAIPHILSVEPETGFDIGPPGPGPC